MIKITFFYYLLCFLSLISSNDYAISGYIKDGSSEEMLIGANIINIDNPIQGASTNTYGFFSLTLPEGNYKGKCILFRISKSDF